MHIAVTILRVQEGLDYTGIIRDFDINDLVKGKQNNEGIDNPTFANSQESDVIETFPTIGMHYFIPLHLILSDKQSFQNSKNLTF
jgi:hypothetical protein